MITLRPINDWIEAGHREGMKDPEYVADWLSLQLSAKLASIIVREGVTRRSIAQKLGVSPAYVSKVLGGHPNMTILSMTKFAMALGLRPTITFEKADASPATETAQVVPAGGRSVSRKGGPAARKPRRLGSVSTVARGSQVAEGRAPYQASGTSRPATRKR